MLDPLRLQLHHTIFFDESLFQALIDLASHQPVPQVLDEIRLLEAQLCRTCTANGGQLAAVALPNVSRAVMARSKDQLFQLERESKKATKSGIFDYGWSTTPPPNVPPPEIRPY